MGESDDGPIAFRRAYREACPLYSGQHQSRFVRPLLPASKVPGRLRAGCVSTAVVVYIHISEVQVAGGSRRVISRPRCPGTHGVRWGDGSGPRVRPSWAGAGHPQTPGDGHVTRPVVRRTVSSPTSPSASCGWAAAESNWPAVTQEAEWTLQ